MPRVFGSFIRWVPIVSAVLFAVGCGGGDSSPTSPSPGGLPFTQTDLRLGTGAEATSQKVVTVNYTGWLYDPTRLEQKGRQFDTSAGRGSYIFKLGAGQVIPGWDQGVAGMKVGGQRRLIIPPDLAYGSAGRPPTIPSNATLVFDIELLDVQG